MQYDNLFPFYRIGRTKISVTDEDKAIQTILTSINEGKTEYVCVSTLRTVAVANRDEFYWKVMENSLMNTPDGTPLVWCGHWWGLKQVQRACGPHIFPIMLKIKDAGLKHFFIGDTEETLSALSQKATAEFGAEVVGSYSPPFAPLEEYDLVAIAKMVNDSGANIVWTALRAPKQDIFNAKLVSYLKNGIICVGVGAAFRSVIGKLKQPDGFLQKIGLSGLIFKRENETVWPLLFWYLKHSLLLLWYFIQILCNRISGKKYYEL